MSQTKHRLDIWIEAMRPQTLPAAIAPVMVGAGLAVAKDHFSWLASSVALICALIIQVGTNFANDYFDFIKGADTEDRVGFQRATAAGLISARQMLMATVGTMTLAFFVGLYLVWIAGWPILVIGIFSLICGIAYTGGPFPLGYNGLGDLFVFLFFGIIAVMGTYYVNALQWTWTAFFCSLPMGALATNILVVNNLRDIEQDRSAGKRTLGVIFGPQALKWEYVLMDTVSIAVPLYLITAPDFSYWLLLPLLTLPWGAYLTRRIWQEKDMSNLNNLLEQTGKWMAVYGFLFAVGIGLSA